MRGQSGLIIRGIFRMVLWVYPRKPPFFVFSFVLIQALTLSEIKNLSIKRASIVSTRSQIHGGALGILTSKAGFEVSFTQLTGGLQHPPPFRITAHRAISTTTPFLKNNQVSRLAYPTNKVKYL